MSQQTQQSSNSLLLRLGYALVSAANASYQGLKNACGVIGGTLCCCFSSGCVKENNSYKAPEIAYDQQGQFRVYWQEKKPEGVKPGKAEKPGTVDKKGLSEQTETVPTLKAQGLFSILRSKLSLAYQASEEKTSSTEQIKNGYWPYDIVKNDNGELIVSHRKPFN